MWSVIHGASGKEPACQCRRHSFDPWVGKIPWQRAWQATLVFLPGKFHGKRNLVGCSPWSSKELDTVEENQHTHTSNLNLNLNGKVSSQVLLKQPPGLGNNI